MANCVGWRWFFRGCGDVGPAVDGSSVVVVSGATRNVTVNLTSGTGEFRLRVID